MCGRALRGGGAGLFRPRTGGAALRAGMVLTATTHPRFRQEAATQASPRLSVSMGRTLVLANAVMGNTHVRPVSRTADLDEASTLAGTLLPVAPRHGESACCLDAGASDGDELRRLTEARPEAAADGRGEFAAIVSPGEWTPARAGRALSAWADRCYVRFPALSASGPGADTAAPPGGQLRPMPARVRRSASQAANSLGRRRPRLRSWRRPPGGRGTPRCRAPGRGRW